MADLLLLTPELATKAVGRHVRDVLVTPVSAGDNYGSSTMRAKAITDEGDTIHLIVKSMAAPELEQQADVPMRPVFDVEGRMYEMMPRMHELLRSVNKAEPPIGPRMLYRQRDPYPMLIFEDMSVQGFRLPSRDAGMDMAHTRLVLRTIARWHAASSIILQDEPALFDNMLPIACEERLVLSDGLMVKGLARFIRNAEGSDEWSDELSKKTVAQLKQLQPTSLQRVMDAYRADPPRQGSEGVHGLHVGLHGDLWSGNILFKYDSSGQPEEARLIDYQVSNPGSPSCDLHYFFATVSGEVRRRRSELVAEYHAELGACLTAMGVRRVVSLAELQADLENRGIVEVLQVTAVTAMTMAPRSVNLSFENFVDIHNGDGPHPRDVCMAREEFRKVAKQFFAAWEEEGLLEKLLAQKKYNS